MENTILSLLPKDYPWADRFHYLPCTDSTNDRLKEMARRGAPHGTVLLADSQTGGHGRMGRSFHSPEDAGIYMSILLRPLCPPQELMHLTCAAAVAVCAAVERSAGFRPGIKWTNDLVWNRQKLGGILTELGLNPKGGVDHAIIGIGINCCQRKQDFPDEIRSIAASLSMAAGRPVDRRRVSAALLEALWEMDSRLLEHKADILECYRRDCITIGQDISLVRGDTVRRGKALAVDDAGALIVEFAPGQTETVNSGEVSVRGMYGYV